VTGADRSICAGVRAWGAIACVCLLLAACQLAQASPGSPEGFQLVVLSQNRADLLPSQYELADSWAVLSFVPLTDSLLTITASDISEYDWTSQIITLTDEGSRKFTDAEKAAGGPFESSMRCFVVTFGGRRLFGGVFLPPESPLMNGREINYPVITVHEYHDTGRRLGVSGKQHPVLAAQPDFGYYTNHETVYEYFRGLGKLTGVAPSSAPPASLIVPPSGTP